MQAVSKEAITDDGRLAYWSSRYTLRTTPTGTAKSAAPPTSSTNSWSQAQQQPGAMGSPGSPPQVIEGSSHIGTGSLSMTAAVVGAIVRQTGSHARQAKRTNIGYGNIHAYSHIPYQGLLLYPPSHTSRVPVITISAHCSLCGVLTDRWWCSFIASVALQAGGGAQAEGKELDVPVFLAACAHLILTTGACVTVYVLHHQQSSVFKCSTSCSQTSTVCRWGHGARVGVAGRVCCRLVVWLRIVSSAAVEATVNYNKSDSCLTTLRVGEGDGCHVTLSHAAAAWRAC